MNRLSRDELREALTGLTKMTTVHTDADSAVNFAFSMKAVHQAIWELDHANVVPGQMSCAKCKCSIQRAVLNAQTGETYAGETQPTPCPNGCGPMWPVTWEQEAREARDLCSDLFERLHKARQENYEQLLQDVRTHGPEAVNKVVPLRPVPEQVPYPQSTRLVVLPATGPHNPDSVELHALVSGLIDAVNEDLGPNGEGTDISAGMIGQFTTTFLREVAEDLRVGAEANQRLSQPPPALESTSELARRLIHELAAVITEAEHGQVLDDVALNTLQRVSAGRVASVATPSSLWSPSSRPLMSGLPGRPWNGGASWLTSTRPTCRPAFPRT